MEGTHSDIPADAVEISSELYGQLLDGQSSGQAIDFSISPPALKARVVQGTAAMERALRDSLLDSTEWLSTRHRDELDMQRPTTLTAEQFSELLTYRQALRDWPQSEAFPDGLQRPIAPFWIAEQNQ
ncbi:phage tail protein [Pseudomonas sp. H9]|nr:phage tail protein [Pseudomonas sp. H9]